MGAKEKALKVVLDTNVLVSALLFNGRAAALVGLWKSGRIVPVFTKETFDEFRLVLSYPKFKLTRSEIAAIIQEEVLPYFEVIETGPAVHGVCTDADDDKFITCALSSSARFLVSGDHDLCAVGKYKSVEVITLVDLLALPE